MAVTRIEEKITARMISETGNQGMAVGAWGNMGSVYLQAGELMNHSLLGVGLQLLLL